ncbi:MAG TPA: hypothetical protein VFG18_07430 [Xanthomonadaceae bacterium]|nr:hypothetical protein [Xanthomonadaceae bacterium]
MNTDHDQICVASCFALSDPRCAAFLNRLGDALAERGTQLVVLATRHAPELEYPQVQIPYSILGFDREIQLQDLAPFHAIAPVALAERAWSGSIAGPDTYARATAKCEWFYQAVAEELRPAGALLWNTTHPHSRVARNVLQASDVPAWCFERGQLAGTYQVQAGEVNAWDDSRVAFAVHAGLRMDLARQTGEAFEAARALSLSAPVDRHPLREAADIAGLPRGNGPTVLVLTSAVGSSIEPTALRTIGLSQPLWPDLQAIVAALDAVLPANATVLFRDHPINREVLGHPLRLPARFVEAHGVPIAELIARADRVACIGTTTLQYEALLRDKPLLVLGRSPATAAEAAYAPARAADLGDCVAAWLEDRDGARRRANARALVGLLCERHLIREDERALHVRNGVAELADFLAAQAVPQAEPVADRIDRFAQRILAACSIGEPA